ncbi:hypothetical protein ACFQX7_07580 [Luedemannella flava]
MFRTKVYFGRARPWISIKSWLAPAMTRVGAWHFIRRFAAGPLDDEAVALMEKRFRRLPLPDYPFWAGHGGGRRRAGGVCRPARVGWPVVSRLPRVTGDGQPDGNRFP